MIRISKLCILVLCIVCIVFEQDVCAFDEFEDGLYSMSAVLMDGDSGRILYEKDGNIKRPMASTTKIMTCIIAIEYGNLECVAKVSKYAASMPDVQLDIKEGQIFKLKDLLYSLMLESHNDTAVVIAECVAGSVEEFATMMNTKAVELGCKDTYFITPNGLDASEGDGVDIKIHSTTARDLAIIMNYCRENQIFLDITQTLEYSFYEKYIDDKGNIVNGDKKYKVINRNTLLKNMPGIITGKTGFTNEAGYCYVCTYESEGRTYIVVLLGCGWPNNKNYKWIDTKKLLKYGSDKFRLMKYNNLDVDLPYVKVRNGICGEYYDFAADGLYNMNDISVESYVEEGDFNILMQSKENISIEINLPDYINAPVKRGQLIGNIRYVMGDEVLNEINIYARESIEKKDFLWSFGVVFMKFIVY